MRMCNEMSPCVVTFHVIPVSQVEEMDSSAHVPIYVSHSWSLFFSLRVHFLYLFSSVKSNHAGCVISLYIHIGCLHVHDDYLQHRRYHLHLHQGPPSLPPPRDTHTNTLIYIHPLTHTDTHHPNDTPSPPSPTHPHQNPPSRP